MSLGVFSEVSTIFHHLLTIIHYLFPIFPRKNSGFAITKVDFQIEVDGSVCIYVQDVRFHFMGDTPQQAQEMATNFVLKMLQDAGRIGC